MSVTPPAFGSLRFSCPHCGAFAHQHWYETRACKLDKDESPKRHDIERLLEIEKEQLDLPPEQRYSDFQIFDEYKRTAKKEVFTGCQHEYPGSRIIYNLDLSRCDSCGEIAVWLKDKLVHPATGPVGSASEDMPPVVRGLYDEAGAVFQTSPKSSAALLRLALQHLLPHIGEREKT